MPNYAIVIDDPVKHHAAEIERNVAHNLTAHGASVSGTDLERLQRRIDRAVRDTVGPPRAAGDLHTVAETDCPDGLPNCRNCGDPAHAQSCAAAGHCPHCGTAHGVAPDGYLAYSGVALVAMAAPADDEMWDRATRRFVKRPPR